jgi:hypothetical protein
MKTSSWAQTPVASRLASAIMRAPLSRTAAISARRCWIRLSRVTISHPRAATIGIQASSVVAGVATGEGGRSRL